MDTRCGNRVPATTLVEALEARVAALEGRVSMLEAERHGRRQPTPADAALLLAVAQTIGQTVFSARELVEHAKATGGPLRAALARAGLHNTRRLGKRLAAIQARPLGGLVLARLGSDSAGAIWSVSIENGDALP